MTIAYWCVLIMIVFPYLFTALAKTGAGFNNHDPREYLSRLSGWRKRAHFIQLNSFESTPAFAVAIIIAHLLHAPQPTLDKLAIAFVIIRVIYAICYLSDLALLRTLFWGAGLACVIALFFIGH